ncbi:MAG TPA: alpha/beta hydrolase [Chthoniobacter sp.]|jgi:acetyl esterase/lipase
MRSCFSRLFVAALAGSIAGHSLAADPAPAAAPATPAPAKPAATPAPSLPVPTLSNVHYGDHERQVLDFYKAESDKPTPLLFFIHGGGWTAGDKYGAAGPSVKPYLAAGISVVAINYRYAWQAQLAGVKPPVEWPLHDAARALQFVRSKAAEWNIDKARIGASGGSAGACSSIWLAMHDDMADPKSSDPVARESTRLWCAAVAGAQTSLDPKQLVVWTPNSRYGGHAFGFMDPKDIKSRDHFFADFLKARDSILPWIKEYSPIEHASADDPPIYMIYGAPPALGQEQKDPTHTANYGVKLQQELHRLGVECELNYPGAPDVKHPSIEKFLIEKLKGPAPKVGARHPYHPPEGVAVEEDVVYGNADGLDLHVDIAYPKQTPEKPIPAVLLIHGGGWAGGTHKGFLPMNLAAHGYFIATVEYRLSGEAPWPAQIDDCKLAIRWLRANAAKYHVDPQRIGVMGHSAGGHLVACLGTLGNDTSLDVGGFADQNSRVQAVVDESGPVDFTPAGRPTIGTAKEDHPGLIKLFGGTYDAKTAAWQQASAALHVTSDTPPFLILHGEQDHLVPIQQAEEMAAALKKAGIPHELIRVKNGGHGLRPDKAGDPAADPSPEAQQELILHFFDQQLKK